jgi:hypothetical protein
MITERLTFRAKYGQGDTLVNLMKESFKVMPMPAGTSGARIYTDHTGPMFTVAVEFDHADIGAYAKASMSDTQEFGSKEFQEWFSKMVAVTELGERQLFNMEKLA